MLQKRVFASIRDVARDDWDACFPAELEDWSYHAAVEAAGLEGFRFRYLAVVEDRRLVAAAAVFITDYALDATVQGPWRRVSRRLAQLAPRLLTLRLYGIGSPVAERCVAGTLEAPPDVRRRRFDALLALARADARALGIPLVALKDVAASDEVLVASCRKAGFSAMPGLPGAALPLPFAGLDEYLASLGKATRKDLRRKMKGDSLRVEWRRDVDDVLARMMVLYDATLARSELSFERLTPDYFAGVLKRMNGRALCALYWQDDELVAFNLVLADGSRMIDKFLCHDPRRTRALNLYFRIWLANIGFCLDNGLTLYESGQAGYATKSRLGCRLRHNLLFFRHRNPFVRVALRLVAHFVRPDRFDPALAPPRPTA